MGITFIANRSRYPQLTIHGYNTPYDDALCGRTQSIFTEVVAHRTFLDSFRTHAMNQIHKASLEYDITQKYFGV